MKKNISIALVTALALCAMSASADTNNVSPDNIAVPPMAPTAVNGAPMPVLYNTNGVRPMDGTAQARPPLLIPIERRAEVANLRASTTAAIREMRAPIQANIQNLRAEIRGMRPGTLGATSTIWNMAGQPRELRASTTAEIKDMRGQIFDMRQQMHDEAQSIRASTTAMRTSIKDEAQKARFDAAHKQTDLVNARLSAAIDRIQTIIERTSTALDNYATQGVDVTASRASLADAATKLDTARTQAAAISLAIESAFASATPKTGLDAVQPLVKGAIQTIQDAHRSIAEAISLVKPGLNATSTPAVAPAPAQ